MAYIDTSKVTIPKGFFEDLNVPKLLDWLNSQPTEDVVPKSEVENINPIQEAIEQKKKENKGFALGVLNELLDEKDVEIKRLEYTLTGVMHSVDKWLDGEELEQDEVNRAITMREKTLRIIEDAKSEIERLEKDNKKLTINMNAFGLTAIRQKEEKDALAREIFKEIEKLAYRFMNDNHYIFPDMVWDIDELKKKYTESEDKE